MIYTTAVLNVAQLKAIFGEKHKEMYYLPTYDKEVGNLYRGSQAYMAVAFTDEGKAVGYGVIQLMPVTHIGGIVEASVPYDKDFARGLVRTVGVNAYVRYIPIIDVYNEYQGEGIGRGLYNTLMGIGVRDVHPLSNTTIIEVTEESMAFWEKLGFKEEGYYWMSLRHRAY